MYDYEKWGCPSREGDIIAYYYNPGMLNQPVLYVKDTLDQKEGKVEELLSLLLLAYNDSPIKSLCLS